MDKQWILEQKHHSNPILGDAEVGVFWFRIEVQTILTQNSLVNRTLSLKPKNLHNYAPGPDLRTRRAKGFVCLNPEDSNNAYKENTWMHLKCMFDQLSSFMKSNYFLYTRITWSFRTIFGDTCAVKSHSKRNCFTFHSRSIEGNLRLCLATGSSLDLHRSSIGSTFFGPLSHTNLAAFSWLRQKLP